MNEKHTEFISESAEVPEKFWDQLIWIHKKLDQCPVNVIRTMRSKPDKSDVIRWRRYIVEKPGVKEP